MVKRMRGAVGRLVQQPRLNFMLTNRIPRRQLTLFMAWFSRRRHPLVRVPSIALWKFFADVDLSDAQQRRFRSLHDCFIRELKPGARPVDPRAGVLVSPCDAIIGATGIVRDGLVLQAKGRPYALAELLTDPELARRHAGGCYVTLRLTAGMYHRFHAPTDCTVEQVTYVGGDTWNVNPIALQRIDRLYCRNERAVIRCRMVADGADGADGALTIVPVAAILVASIRLHCLGQRLHLRYRGPSVTRCAASYARGDELGWFEHGSTIILFVPPRFTLIAPLGTGYRVRAGQALFAPAGAV
jgi:phosphatidylserine decarboxylase